MFVARRVGALLAVAALSLAPVSASAHSSVLSGGERYWERCGIFNTQSCAVYRVKVTGLHGQSAYIPGDSNVFDVAAGIQEAAPPEVCDEWTDPDQLCSNELVTRIRVCLGYTGLGILGCVDETRTAEDFHVQVGVVSWPATHSNCGNFYMQTEAWGVNFHMPFQQEGMLCS